MDSEFRFKPAWATSDIRCPVRDVKSEPIDPPGVNGSDTLVPLDYIMVK
jgi:hypothetical protein